jgi:hypothetical protein
MHIHVDGLTTLFVCMKRLELAFKLGFKFPVGGSVPVAFISLVEDRDVPTCPPPNFYGPAELHSSFGQNIKISEKF